MKKLAILAAALTVHASVHAFKLRPHATDTEKRITYLEAGRVSFFVDAVTARVIDHFGSPVHEEITQRIYGCGEAASSPGCAEPMPYGRFAPAGVLFGVQWNDNPPFRVTNIKDCPVETIRLPNYSACWIKLFDDAEKKAKAGKHFKWDGDEALIYRVHFGDMQFLHAMGSWTGESAEDTKERIMAWAQLTYRTAIGDLPKGTLLAKSGIARIDATFRRKGWTIEGFFALGQSDDLKNAVPDIAFGSLLHMVQDSFAKGHVRRDESSVGECAPWPSARKAGDVKQFQSYEKQNKGNHGRADSRNAFEAHLLGSSPTAVDVGRVLVAMRAARTSWSTVSQYLDLCVFPLLDDDRETPAEAGWGFEE